jgi:hypothetical protein
MNLIRSLYFGCLDLSKVFFYPGLFLSIYLIHS